VATVSNLFVDQGADYSNIITVGTTTGSVLNLTGYTVKSQMRKSYGSTTAYDFTASVYDAAAGKVRLQLTAAYASSIPAGRYLYDIEITSSIGSKTRILEGTVIVTPEITKT